MAIIGQAGIRQRIWRGYDDPGLPVGMYVGWAQVTGDVSGGDSTVLLNYEPSELKPAQRPGRFYNIEQLEIFQSTLATDVGQLLLINWSVEIDAAFTNRQYTAQLTLNQGGDSALRIQDKLTRPIFLGQAAQRGTTASVRYVSDNVDGTVIVLWCEGYIWEPRSVQSEGGLRRPADSLYGG